MIATGAATKSAMYNLFDKLSISNNVFLSCLPVFVETNDIYSVDFFRPKLQRTQEGDLSRLGWAGENGEYPRYIGAKPPYYPGGFSLKIR